MKRQFSCAILLFFVSLWSMGQKQKKPVFEINGDIKGLQDDSVYIIIWPESGKRIPDTLATKASGNQFHFKGVSTTTSQVSMILGNIRSNLDAPFYLEPGKITIAGNIDSLDYLLFTGTPTNDDFTASQRFLGPIYERRSVLYKQLRNFEQPEQQKQPEAQRIAIEIEKKNDSIDNYKIGFMEQHRNSDISLGYLYVLQDELPVETVQKFYNSFSADLKKSSTGEYIYSKLKANKQVAIGNKALDFTATDINGNQVKLSDFKGKYVLLEFWASWCVPCRAQSPHLVKIYDTFKDKGFIILQYSLDVKKDEQKWRDAIRQDGLVWTQISNIEQSGTDVARLYGVQPIPDNFLISPDGTILGRRLSAKELEEQLSKWLN